MTRYHGRPGRPRAGGGRGRRPSRDHWQHLRPQWQDARPDWNGVNTALDHVLASVPEVDGRRRVQLGAIDHTSGAPTC